MGFDTQNPEGNEAIMVNKDQGGGINAEAYVFNPPADPNPFFINWETAGGFSSYDLQAKIATGTLSGTVSLTNQPDNYANGILIRGDAGNGQQSNFMAVSFVRNGQLAPQVQVQPPSWTEWQTYTDYYVNDTVKYNNDYYICYIDHNSSKKFDDNKWKFFSPSFIVFWVRTSNHHNGDGVWLAYKILDSSGKDYVVDRYGYTKNWSTLMIRVIEAASVKLTVSLAPNINIGDTVLGLAGTGTAKVFRKIKRLQWQYRFTVEQHYRNFR